MGDRGWTGGRAEEKVAVGGKGVVEGATRSEAKREGRRRQGVQRSAEVSTRENMIRQLSPVRQPIAGQGTGNLLSPVHCRLS